MGRSAVKRKPPKYTHGFSDHLGKPRYYLRVPGRKRVPLPGLPWSPEFMEARERALKEEWTPRHSAPAEPRPAR
jgi:hypothetical protein